MIAACNPIRSNSVLVDGREKDLGRAWVAGHYQVNALPPSIDRQKWSFGSLTMVQEQEFINRRIELVSIQANIHSNTWRSMADVVATCHEAMRDFAARNIIEVTSNGNKNGLSLDEARIRARTVVSLRDIQRVFSLFSFFMNEFGDVTEQLKLLPHFHKRCMLLSVAIVYYLRLDARSRVEFLDVLRCLPGGATEACLLEETLNYVLELVIKNTNLPKGIAPTRGLKENVFMALACCLSRTPLMIVGPPGTSKTLSVNTVSDNAKGEDSCSKFFRQLLRISVFHYQCSKGSTSTEIASIFEKATRRQEKVKHQCVVLMDEAGLPPEDREPLKVLHYLLEGHMSMKAKVGFVAITNHVLDAAKSNRCVMLLRQEPDMDEMCTIVDGVLFDHKRASSNFSREVVVDGRANDALAFAKKLAESYANLIHGRSGLPCFESFFGLRDFIYFLKALRVRSRFDGIRMSLTTLDFLEAVERNFNGIRPTELRQIAFCFIRQYTETPAPAFPSNKIGSAPEQITSLKSVTITGSG